ncbi:hypothetical protein O6H91_14G068300 [Diphasiastrum complanatum]|uniref:Uncharacterized protein n=1 Tax=Diphasiastrum complanatum TaxID=34168 RepID=A0ACC2BQI9_DIPCM|nr:hypothetical protein O6H91_14G068300 [Diphasiastrum complanatum]
MTSLGRPHAAAINNLLPETRGPLSKFDCFLFDLDDTLYPMSLGLSEACGNNIRAFMVEKLGISEFLVDELSSRLYKHHGTTMAGLRAAGYEFEFDEYHDFAHGRLPYHLLEPDYELRDLLLSLPQRKIIFTNADRVHALKVLKRLELEDCFEDIISFETIMDHRGFASEVKSQQSQPTQVVCKPSLEAMRRAINIGQIDPTKTLFFDDSVRNIIAGKAVGLHTALVGSAVRIEEADYVVHSIHDVAQGLLGIWEKDYAKFRQEILSN